MKINDIAKEIAKREGKKSQTSIGDIKEILGIIADMIYDDINKSNINTYHTIVDLAISRVNKRNAKNRVKKVK